MVGIVFGADATLRGVPQEEAAAVMTADNPSAGSESFTNIDFYDQVRESVISSGSISNFDIIVSPPIDRPGAVFQNNTPSICDVSEGGAVTWKANGTAEVVVSAWGGKTKVQRAISNSGATFLRHGSYKTGSLGEHVVAAIDALISGKTPGDSTQARWQSNNFNTDAPNAVENPGLITGSLSLEAISVMKSGATNDIFPGLLVTERHILGAWHVLPAVGQKIVWKTSGGGYKSAVVVSRKQVLANGLSDTGVAQLDSAVTGVAPFKLLPADWRNHIGSLRTWSEGNSVTWGSLPSLVKSYNSPTSIKSRINIIEQNTLGQSTFLPQMTETYRDWHYPVDGGDSGSPLMIPVNGELVLVSAYYTRAGGSPYADFLVQINDAMNALATVTGDPAAGTYAVSTVDLSGFTNYA